jgi:hypothetical protein
MGANATTFVPAYVSGEVLTAADLTVTNSGIPVFADSTARTAAFGGTGEKVLAEGQYAYLESDNSTSVWDGAAWKSVGVAPGLVYITGASFSAASTVSFPADTFTTTYDNYRVMLRLTAATANNYILGRYRAGGSDDSSGNYLWTYYGLDSAFAGTTAGSQTAMALGFITNSASSFNCMSADIFAPKLAARSFVLYQQTGTNVAASSALFANGGSRMDTTTQYDSFTIYPLSGTITGEYKVYGYSNS